MKVEELQINDWVRYTDEDGTFNVQVKGITIDVYFRHPLAGEVVFADPDRFEPIPLSVEILKANGFGFVSLDDDNLFSNEDKTVVIDTYRETEWEVDIYRDLERIGGGFVEYVHELQHLLKLWKPEMAIEIKKTDDR